MKDHVTAFFTGKVPGADTAQLGRIFNIGVDKIYMPIQKHTDKIVLIESSHLSPVTADAVITKEPGMLIGVQVADCVPILLYEKGKGVMAAVHAGWRGTAESILKKTIMTMTERFFGSAEDICIAIGPAIRGWCYQVDFDVFHAVSKATGPGDYSSTQGGKYYLDLPKANKHQALSSGIPEENIWVSDDCTFCRPDKYYSYRFAKGTTGRQGAFIGKL